MIGDIGTFEIAPARRVADAIVVGLTGEVDLGNANDAERAVFAELGGETEHAVLDLTGLDYLDSAGVRMLFELSERIEGAGGRLDLVVPADTTVRTVLSITKLDTLVPTHESVEIAMAVPRASDGT